MRSKFLFLYRRFSIMSYREIFFYRIPRLFMIMLFYFRPPHFRSFSYRKDLSFHFNQSFIKEVDLYDYAFFDISVSLDKVTNWNYDYKNNLVSQNKFYSLIDRQDIKNYGDVKYVSELSRFHFLPFFALRWNSTKDKEYIDFISNVISSWNYENPYLKSINWTSGIEVGIRAINIIYTYLILQDDQNKIKEDLKIILEKSYHFLKNHLSLYSSANNHLIAELSALNIISIVFTNQEIEEENSKWKKMFYDEVLQQINRDGVNMELSTRYHTEVLDYIINTFLFLRKNNIVIPKEILYRLKGAAEFLSHVSYNNNVVEFGDSDEGYVINPYFDKNFNYYKSVYESISILLDKSSEGRLDFRNKLLFPDYESTSFDPSVLLEDQVFEDSGYLFLYDHRNRTKLSFDFGTIGDQVNGAHGHSDIFHFNLESNGFQYLVDSGTFQYHKKFTKWRNYFRSPVAHNTISFNKKFHGDVGGRMLWLKQPEQPKILAYKKNKNIYFASKVFFEEVDWIRELTFNKDRKEILIIDSIFAKKDIELSYFLQFNPLLEKIVRGKKDLTLYKNQNQYLNIEFNFENFKIFAGEDNDRIIGWNSHCFGRKEKSNVLEYNCLAQENKVIKTRISYFNS